MTARVTIAFTRYAEPNWLIRETIDSLSRQEQILLKSQKFYPGRE